MASIFWWLDLSRDFLGIQNNPKIRGSARISWLRSPANKVQPNLFLPGWSCLKLSFIMLLLKQMFLGVPSVVRMTTDEEKIKSTGMMNNYKQTQAFNFVLYHLILFGNFRKFGMRFFGG